MSDVDDLVTWLRTQLNGDAVLAREAANGSPGPWQAERTPDGTQKVVDDLGHSVVEHRETRCEPWFATPHIARHDPARVLAEVDAKRLILDECESAIRKSAPRSNLNDLGWLVLRPLALPYADRPGYRDEWRP